jgi:hypothetical protein
MPYCQQHIAPFHDCEDHTNLECKLCGDDYCSYHLSDIGLCKYCNDSLEDEDNILYYRIVDEIKNHGRSSRLKNIIAIVRTQLNINANEENDENEDNE